jgi:hypothetical protein
MLCVSTNVTTAATGPQIDGLSSMRNSGRELEWTSCRGLGRTSGRGLELDADVQIQLLDAEEREGFLFALQVQRLLVQL